VIGLKKQNYVASFMIQNLTFLELMQVSRYLFGDKRVGYMKKIQEVGFSGIADTIWGAVFQMKMQDKSKDGF
jgi:hypothetical protein